MPTESKEQMSLLSQQDWTKLQFGPPKAKPVAPPVVAERPAVQAETIATSEVSVENLEEVPEDLEDTSEEPQVISVSELNRAIKGLLEGEFSFLWVKGEISNFKAHTSGHFYFSLKDSKCQISAVMFKGFNAGLKFRPEDGMEVLVRGKVTVYEPRGNYQIFCEVMEPVGAGALQKAYEQLKAKLQSEGLFAPERKRALPALPRHIAIVTSPTGAAIRDMLNVLGRRFRGVTITVLPCKVQGDQAPGEIVQALASLNRMSDVDVAIVGRGGGSIEDLWAFNDEKVARALAACKVPVISAVGHEIDFTIADFVADVRAPTPSAAAELVVKNAADLITQITRLGRGLKTAWGQWLLRQRQNLDGLSKRLIDPQRSLQDASLRCDELLQRLENSWQRYLTNQRFRIELLVEKMGSPEAHLRLAQQNHQALQARLQRSCQQALQTKQQKLSQQMALLDSLSPLRVVERGYSLVSKKGELVKDATQVQSGDILTVQFAKGKAEAKVEKILEV